jgi:hypothetical protein
MRYYCKGIDVISAFHTDDATVDPASYGFGTYIVIVPGGVPPTMDPVALKFVPFPDVTNPTTISVSTKDECGRRILAEVDADQQRNINAYISGLQQTLITGGTLTPAQTTDIATATAIFQWIGRPNGMQGTSDALIAAADTQWWLDGKWPPWDPTSAGWSAFVARF